jgi:hypothetical protein
LKWVGNEDYPGKGDDYFSVVIPWYVWETLLQDTT